MINIPYLVLEYQSPKLVLIIYSSGPELFGPESNYEF